MRTRENEDLKMAVSMFAGIEEVTVKKDSAYVEPGNYLAKINAIKYGKTNESDRPYFVVEMEVIESDNPNFEKGDTMAWMTMLHRFKHYFLEDVKGFIAVATGYPPDQVISDVVEYVAGEEQPLTGQGLRVRAKATTNANSGKVFTKTTFAKVDLDVTGDHPLQHATSTDRFGPACDEDGGAAVAKSEDVEAVSRDFHRELKRSMREGGLPRMDDYGLTQS